MNSNRITDLTWKYLKSEISDAEREELNEWLSDPVNRERFEQRIKMEGVLEGVISVDDLQAEAEQQDITRFTQTVKGSEKPPRETWRIRTNIFKWKVAAVVTLIGGGIAFWTIRNVEKPENKKAQPIVMNPSSGANVPTLVLSDGAVLRLDAVNKGVVARQGGSNVVKSADGQLAYEKGNSSGPEAAFNTLITPKGGQYQLRLADGSRVWLNAGSSLRFPAVFKGPDRQVTLEGEAYFEIVNDKDHPFSVKTKSTEVTVLGTSFDIMAYSDENVLSTSLLTGAVKVTTESTQRTLVPGQQAVIQPTTGAMQIHRANVEQFATWKNGVMEFEGADLGTVMRAFARWWNVTVQYSDDSNQHAFTGQLNMKLPMSEALQILTASGYKFKVQDRTVKVLPQ